MDTSRAGGAVVSRTAALLRALSDSDAAGATTSALARAVDLPRATAHRLLTSLSAEGLVDRTPDSGLWVLGPELYVLGSIAAQRYDIATTAADILAELARSTGESAFLSARRGDETVVLSSVEGTFPLRSHVLHPGKRLPLGIASAGIVVLAHLPDADVDRYLASVDLVPDWGPDHAVDDIRDRIAQTRIDGYSVNPALLVEGSWGIGAAVFDRAGRPEWAISLNGVETRFSQARRPQLGEALLRAAHDLTRRVR